MTSVIIPSYNRRDCVLKLLGDVFSQEGEDFEVIVVDDCSGDDTVKRVREEFPQVKLLVNEKNSGPSVTRNRGIRAASGDWIVGFDSDVSLADRHLLAKAAGIFRSSPETTGIAFRLFKPDGKSEDTARWWHPVPVKDFAHRTFATSYFSGTAFAFRRGAIVGAGLFPEILYMHYEEVELAFRVLDQGGVIVYRPDLSVIHHANEVSKRGEIQVFYKPRNQVLITLSTYPFWYGIKYLVPRITYQFSAAIRGGHFSDFRRAMADAMTKGKGILRERRPVRRGTMKKISSLSKQAIG